MAEKSKKTKAAAKKSAPKKRASDSHEFETMSQQQNRYGKGREHNGSDGGRVGGRGSNH